MTLNLKKLLKPENNLERKIVSDSEFVIGANYGEPREGHPEGQVAFHILDVLKNVDKYSDSFNRVDLRLIALIHDTFKYKVDYSKSRKGRNHHSWIAMNFAKKYKLSKFLLQIIRMHDEAYHCWLIGSKEGDWKKAEKTAKQLIKKLGKNLKLFLIFYKCDNFVEGKTQEHYEWFKGLIGE